MKKIFFVIVLLSTFGFSQGEANIWYFGQNAGLDFNSGNPVALTNGQLVTDEGCATLSNSSGDLLFYTDGITVYNKNHSIMANGTGLMGNSSSTQSATIVQKPGSISLFYIFTTDNEHDPNGFRYSIVDMNLDSGNGAVTTDKNVLVYTPTIENLGVTKHGNGQDFWIITHGWNSNSFITYQLSSSGLSLIPVVSNIGTVITGGPNSYVAAGSIKISPNGSKLAFTSVSDIAQLFDFNNSTGVLTNAITLLSETGDLYGAAFSPDESFLYLSNTFGKIHQFNLNVTDIPNSKITLHNGNTPGQLQLGPDNKIYVAFGGSFYLGVINNPNSLGSACDFQIDGIYLGGKKSRLGLPSFNQSFFFTPSIQLSSNCEGKPSNFTFFTNQTVLSSTWDFGDGNYSSDVSPTYTYATSGTFNVSVTVTTALGTGTNTRQITIYPNPVLLQTSVTLKQCDDDNDGYSSFNLNETSSLLVSNTTGLTFTYFESQQNAIDNQSPIVNPTTYTNQIVSNDEVYVRVTNANGCFAVAQILLNVSTTLIPNSFQRIFTQCDDVSNDSIATFNFSGVTSEIQALYPVGQQLVISYYKNLADALAEQNAITNPSNYTNTGYPNSQNIYIRVDSQLNNECLGLGHHITLVVEKQPIINAQSYTECDDNQDGIFAFSTTNINTTILNGLPNVSLSFWDANNIPLSSPLPNPFVTPSQTIKVRATNNTTNACFYETTINFTVSVLPQVFPIASSLTSICDDEVNPIQQNGNIAFDTSSFQSTILGSQTGMIVNYYSQIGTLLSSPLPNPFVSSSQNITVEVVNPINTNCKALMIIPLIVKSLPEIELSGNELICSDNPLFTKIINAGLVDTTTIANHTYQWYLDGILLNNETNYNLTVNTAGTYTVEVTNGNNCSRTRTITVVASNIATINSIIVTDLEDYNSVNVVVSGDGDYLYSIDAANYQESSIFNNLLAGVYTVYVKDELGCGIAQEEVNVLGIPKYFTPNGDGYNDYWNLIGLNQLKSPVKDLKIYNRFGKILKQINTNSQGWDGSYNDKIMPSDDYWYAIEFQNGKVIKGHFALKR